MSGNREAAEAIRAAVEAQRGRLVPGTVEKYPGAGVPVRIIDAEELLAENERLREALEEISVWPFTSASDAKHMQQIARDAYAAR